MSGGKFQITTHAPGELVPAFGTVDAVKDGTVEMANTAPYYYFGKDETFALACAIPFGLNARQMAAWYYEGNGLKLMREFYAKYNIISFPGGNSGAQMGGWWRKELKTVADLQGVFSPAGSLQFDPVPPQRLLDTRGATPQGAFAVSRVQTPNPGATAASRLE